MQDIWPQLAEQFSFSDLRGKGYRLVESQEQVATNQLVDSFDEQDLLEQMLEQSKPCAPPQSDSLHYLLWTPFRYPPLKHGSRFGNRFEASLFYASQQASSALAESAYYRLLFWSGMAQSPSEAIVGQHSLFSIRYASNKGVALHQPPFTPFIDQLKHPSDYRSTQQLGSQLREQGAELIEFISARDPNNGINIALYTPQAIACRQPLTMEQWLSHTDAQQVAFKARGKIEQFPAELFYVDGVLPQPAF